TAQLNKSLAIPSHAILQSPDTLGLGEPHSRGIKGGQKWLFEITLTAGQYARVVVRSSSIILRVTLSDPTGKQLVIMNNPSGGFGRIYVSEIASSSGKYLLEIGSTEEWANPGSFELALEELRNSSLADARRIEAERWFAKGLKEDESRSFKTAIGEFGKSLSYWQAIRDPYWEALTQYSIGQTYRRAGDTKKAEEHFIESLKIQVDEVDWRIRAAALNDLGINNTNAGNNETALSLLTQSLKLFEAHADRRGQASSLNNLATTHARIGSLRTSLDMAQKVLALRLAENYQLGANNARNTLGNIYDRLGDPYKSLEYHTQALQSWQQLAKTNQLDSPDRLANAFNSVAIATEKVGNWDQANQAYDKALSVPNVGAALRAAILSNKGDLYASLGDFETAMVYFEDARTALASLPRADPDTKASIILQIGQLHAAAGNYDAAATHFNEAQGTKPNPPKLAYIFIALGDLWSSKGDFEEALKAYGEALKLKTQDGRSRAITLQKLGETYVQSRDYSSASNQLVSALSLWRLLKDRRGEAATLNSLAILERERTNLATALKYSEEATSILESLRTKLSSHKLRTSYFARHENYYELNIELKMMLSGTERSGELVESALMDSEKSRARSLIDALVDARSGITKGVSGELVELERQIQQKLRAKLEAQTVLLSAKHKETEAKILAQEISELLRQHDQINARIRVASPRYSELLQPQLASVSAIRQQLDQETLLVEYALGDKRSYAWVVSSDSVKAFELPARNVIDATAGRLVNALIKNEETGYSEASAALSKMVIGPLGSSLDRKRLVIVADGALQFVPFSALVIPNTAQTMRSQTAAGRASQMLRSKSTNLPLISRYEIVTLPSASVLALQRRDIGNRKPAPLSVAILADPVFNADDERVANARTSATGNGGVARKAGTASSEVQKLTSDGSESLNAALRSIGLKNITWLPFSREEAEAIEKVVPQGERFTALDFDASRATAASPFLAKYKILHIATHGVMDLEHPELSGVILSMVDAQGKPVDGYLRLHEIYNLNLPAELVVLSACQTGVGKQVRGEGLIALTRGFMYAGAKSVVASYWKVNDKATAELMAEFYKQMFVNKQKPAAALRLAQIKLSESRRWHQPQYWAGFFLQGEWN
ncbi:MAG TPA: CHAT domain-containing protein, partial [Pyrinomonadaceae bacterium]|nr:CHAT domain-containing protein [Pyrinomonadaceae bacterium]